MKNWPEKLAERFKAGDMVKVPNSKNITTMIKCDTGLTNSYPLKGGNSGGFMPWVLLESGEVVS